MDAHRTEGWIAMPQENHSLILAELERLYPDAKPALHFLQPL